MLKLRATKGGVESVAFEKDNSFHVQVSEEQHVPSRGEAMSDL
jgi:hypothetical protein